MKERLESQVIGYLVKQSPGERRHEVVEAGHGTGRLAHDGDVVLVAAERGNVTINPFQSQDLIVHTLRILKRIH